MPDLVVDNENSTLESEPSFAEVEAVLRDLRAPLSAELWILESKLSRIDRAIEVLTRLSEGES